MLPTSFDRARAVRAPDESYRLRCPDCNAVFGEYLDGTFRGMCRRCKWVGIIMRYEPSLVQSVYTIRAGQEVRQPQF